MAINDLYYLHTNELLNELKPFQRLIAEDELQEEKLTRIFTAAGVDFKIYLTAIKLYKKVYSRRDSYLMEYETTKNKITLEYYEMKQRKSVNTRLPRGLDHKSIYDTLEQTDRDYALYEKAVIRDLFYDNYLVLIGCFVISCKMYQDISYTNDSWEPVTGIDFKRINLVERVLLEALEYDLYFSGEKSIKNEIAALLEIQSKQNVSAKGMKKLIKKLFCLGNKAKAALTTRT